MNDRNTSTLDYFYGQQADQFTFYRIPKVLFTDPFLRQMSTDAKLLYGLLLDRMQLSMKNRWLDEKNRVYIIYRLEDIMDAMQCADRKATKLLNELEQTYGLIERKRQGLGRPNLIFVKNFISLQSRPVQNRQNNDSGEHEDAPEMQSQKEMDAENRTQEPEPSEEPFSNRENDQSRTVKTTIQEPSESRDNSNTDFIETYCSDISPFPSSEDTGKERKDLQERMDLSAYFYEQLSLETLLADHPYEQDLLEEIIDLLIDTCCSKRQMIRIAGDDKPANVVKAQLMKLDMSHIRFVLSCMKQNTTKVRNMKQYLLAALYNAPLTISNYYASMVQHDMANGKL